MENFNKLGKVKIFDDSVQLDLPRVYADGYVDFQRREITVAEWTSATKERIIALPIVMKFLRDSLTKFGINPSDYHIYLYGSLSRGQCRGSIDKPWYSSDIDLAICDSNKVIGSLISPKLSDAISTISFEYITPIPVSLGRTPDHFDKIHSIKLS